MNNSTFTLAPGGGALLRDVVPRRGLPYMHACSKAAFEKVCHAIDDLDRDHVPFMGEDLVAAVDEPSTQVFTALAFLKDRGCVIPSRYGRSHVAASPDVYLDGMIEWHALADEMQDAAAARWEAKTEAANR